MPKDFTIETTGPAEAQRFFIVDEDGNFWNAHESRWTNDPRERTLFNDLTQARLIAWELNDAQTPGKWQHFTFPVAVSVKTTESVSLARLRAWLAAAVRLEIDTDSHGPGPVEGSVATVSMGLMGLKWEPTLGQG